MRFFLFGRSWGLSWGGGCFVWKSKVEWSDLDWTGLDWLMGGLDDDGLNVLIIRAS